MYEQRYSKHVYFTIRICILLHIYIGHAFYNFQLAHQHGSTFRRDPHHDYRHQDQHQENLHQDQIAKQAWKSESK